MCTAGDTFIELESCKEIVWLNFLSNAVTTQEMYSSYNQTPSACRCDCTVVDAVLVTALD